LASPFLVVVCDKLGVSVNTFITTPAGAMIVTAAVYKLGMFSSLWSIFKGSVFTAFLIYILVNLNTKKKVSLKTYNEGGAVTKTEEVLVPKFNAVIKGSNSEQTLYSVLASLACFVALCITIASM
jgi:hypothetical protein